MRCFLLYRLVRVLTHRVCLYAEGHATDALRVTSTSPKAETFEIADPFFSSKKLPHRILFWKGRKRDV